MSSTEVRRNGNRREAVAGAHAAPSDLRTPVERYAVAIDRRDEALFASAFTPDATLTVPVMSDPNAADIVLRGSDELRDVVRRIERYDRTFHMVGQVLIDREEDAVAHGEAYCAAHHWRAVDDDATEHMVLFIRYEDRYRRDLGDGWLISARTVHVDGTEITRTGRSA